MTAVAEQGEVRVAHGITYRVSRPMGVEIPTSFVSMLASLPADLRPDFVAAVEEASQSFPHEGEVGEALQEWSQTDDNTRLRVAGDPYINAALAWARRFSPGFQIPERGLGSQDGPNSIAEAQFHAFYAAVDLLSVESAEAIVRSLPRFRGSRPQASEQSGTVLR